MLLCPLDFSNSNIAYLTFFALLEEIVKYLLEPGQPHTIVAIFWWLIVFAIFVEDNGRCLVLRKGHCHCRYFSNVCQSSWLYRRSWISFQNENLLQNWDFAITLMVISLNFNNVYHWTFTKFLLSCIIATENFDLSIQVTYLNSLFLTILWSVSWN